MWKYAQNYYRQSLNLAPPRKSCWWYISHRRGVSLPFSHLPLRSRRRRHSWIIFGRSLTSLPFPPNLVLFLEEERRDGRGPHFPDIDLVSDARRRKDLDRPDGGGQTRESPNKFSIKMYKKCKRFFYKCEKLFVPFCIENQTAKTNFFETIWRAGNDVEQYYEGIEYLFWRWKRLVYQVFLRRTWDTFWNPKRWLGKKKESPEVRLIGGCQVWGETALIDRRRRKRGREDTGLLVPLVPTTTTTPNL